MKGTRFLSVLFLAGILGWITVPAWAQAQEGILFKVAGGPSSDYCHMKFPAIREGTLSSPHPALKDASDGDLIDFYGPCNHDPLGKEEVQAQKLDEERRFSAEYSG